MHARERRGYLDMIKDDELQFLSGIRNSLHHTLESLFKINQQSNIIDSTIKAATHEVNHTDSPKELTKN